MASTGKDLPHVMSPSQHVSVWKVLYKITFMCVHAGNPTFIVEKFGSRCVAQYLGYRLGHLHSLLECLP